MPNVRQEKGDGCALPYADQSFEIAFSNSVIEHVGDLSKQTAFAREVRRVGRKVWVQTPALECPFEPHLLAIGLHWIPGSLGYLARKYLSPRAWIDGPGSETMQDILGHTRLLSRREFGELFPDCRIVTERILWVLPKSYIAIRDSAAFAAVITLDGARASASICWRCAGAIATPEHRMPCNDPVAIRHRGIPLQHKPNLRGSRGGGRTGQHQRLVEEGCTII